MRYFGKDHDIIRRTRQITVLPRPADKVAVAAAAVTEKTGQHFSLSTVKEKALSARFYGVCCLALMLLASVGVSIPIT